MGMNYVQVSGSNKATETRNQVRWLQQLEQEVKHLSGEDCRVAEKNENNAIAKFLQCVGKADNNGTVYRWIGVANQAVYDIVNDKKRQKVLTTEYILNKMKVAVDIEKMKWQEERQKQLAQKRKVGVEVLEKDSDKIEQKKHKKQKNEKKEKKQKKLKKQKK